MTCFQYFYSKRDDVGEKRLLYTASSSSSTSLSTASATPGEIFSLTETPETPVVSLNPPFETMTLLQLDAVLKSEEEVTKKLLLKVIAKLGDEKDTSIVDFYRGMASSAEPAEPAEPAEEGKKDDDKVDIFSGLSEYASGMFNLISGSKSAVSPEAKAVEHKKRMLADVNRLVSSKNLSVSVELREKAAARLDIEAARYEEWGMHWTDENKEIAKMAAYAMGGYFAASFLWNILSGEEDSVSDAFLGTVKMAAYGIGGVSAVALTAKIVESVVPDTGAGKLASKVLKKMKNIPGVTQWEQMKAQEASVSLEDKEIEQAVDYQDLIALLKAYKRNTSHVYLGSIGAEIQGRTSIFQQLQIVLERLKSRAIARSKLSAVLQSIDLNSSISTEIIDRYLDSLTKASLEDMFEGEVPPSITGILEERDGLLRTIDSNRGDIPNAAYTNYANPFRRTIEMRTWKTAQKLEKLKDYQSLVLDQCGDIVKEMLGRKSQAAIERDKLAAALSSDETRSSVDKRALKDRLSALNIMLTDYDRFVENYNTVLHKSSGLVDQLDTMQQEMLVDPKDELFTSQSSPPGNKKEILNTLYDNMLGIEIIAYKSLDIPDNIVKRGFYTDVVVSGLMGLFAMKYGTTMLAAGAGVGMVGMKSLFNRLIKVPTKTAVEGVARVSTVTAKTTAERVGGIRIFGEGALYAVGITCMVNALLAGSDHLETYLRLDKVGGNSALSVGLRGLAGGIDVVAGTSEMFLAFRAASIFGRQSSAWWGGARALGMLGVIALMDIARNIANKKLDQWAVTNEMENIPFASIPSDQLVGLLSLYADRGDRIDILSQALHLVGIKLNLSALVSGATPYTNTRKQMRKEILKALGRKDGRGDEGAKLLLKFYKKYQSDYQFHPDNTREATILTQGLLFISMVDRAKKIEASLNDGAAMNSVYTKILKIAQDDKLSSTSLEDMITALSQAHQQIQEGITAEQLRGKEYIVSRMDPEARFLLESFGGDYDEVLKFYYLCYLARDNTNSPPNPVQKEKLNTLIKAAALYIEFGMGGFRGAVPSKAELEAKYNFSNGDVSYQVVETFLSSERNRGITDSDANNNSIIHYYIEEYLRTVVQINASTPQSLSEAEKKGLKAYLQNECKSDLMNDNVEKLDKLLSYQFFIGEHDKKLHRKLQTPVNGEGYKEKVYMGGEWYDVTKIENSGSSTTSTLNDDGTIKWEEKSKSSAGSKAYNYLVTTVDGIQYIYLGGSFKTFLIEDPNNLPSSWDGFSMTLKYDSSDGDGEQVSIQDADYDLLDKSRLTKWDLPQSVLKSWNTFMKASQNTS